MKKKFLTLLLCGCMLAGMTGCAGEDSVEEENIPVENLADGDLPTEISGQMLDETVNLMDGIELMSVETEDIDPGTLITEFGVPLFQNAVKAAKEGENVLVSPISAWSALCMAEGGAAGETKAQMQKVLALSDKEYYLYMLEHSKKLESGDGYQVNMANGIWYKNVSTLHVEDSFLQYNKTFFDAAAYRAPFNEETLQEINHWVAEHTDDMIPGILNEIKEEDVMYLINALSFDAEWQNIYREDMIWKDVFTTENGKEQLVPMLHADESVYLEDENATGFLKYYKGQKYAFVALLPKEGTTVAEYVETLTADNLNKLLENRIQTSVETTMPKFSAEYSFELNDMLQQMGMVDAFDEDQADFSRMATSDIGNIYISKVLQKTFLAVDEKGTKAGAATAVVMANKMAMMQKKVVNLNRPFVYMIVECDNFEPLFMGTMMNVEETK